MKRKANDYRDYYSGGSQAMSNDNHMTKYSPAHDVTHYIEALENPNTPAFEPLERFENKNAWVVRDTANNVICLQSYDTIVSYAVADKTVDLGVYSSTTTRHQNNFRIWVSNHF